MVFHTTNIIYLETRIHFFGNLESMEVMWPRRSIKHEALRLFDCEEDFFQAVVKREREREVWMRFTW
jgi:hypothetical protein